MSSISADAAGQAESLSRASCNRRNNVVNAVSNRQRHELSPDALFGPYALPFTPTPGRITPVSGHLGGGQGVSENAIPMPDAAWLE